jgi:hypothetical protein
MVVMPAAGRQFARQHSTRCDSSVATARQAARHAPAATSRTGRQHIHMMRPQGTHRCHRVEVPLVLQEPGERRLAGGLERDVVVVALAPVSPAYPRCQTCHHAVAVPHACSGSRCLQLGNMLTQHYVLTVAHVWSAQALPSLPVYETAMCEYALRHLFFSVTCSSPHDRDASAIIAVVHSNMLTSHLDQNCCDQGMRVPAVHPAA